MVMSRGLFLLVLAVGLLTVQANPASPFRCPTKLKVSEEFTYASSVFLGEAIAQEYKSKLAATADKSKGGSILVIKFKVETWWKGSGAKEIEMYTAEVKQPDGTIISESEDYPFRVGEKYLVYAVERDRHLTTGKCRRTARKEQAKEDLLELGKGWVPSQKSG